MNSASMILLFAAPLSSVAAQDVYVLDPSGGPGLYTSVYEALAAGAGDGDVLLVREGAYVQSIDLEGLGLAIVADVGATPSFGGADISLSDSDDVVVLRGLEFSGWIGGDVPTVKAGDGGTVWFEDCTIDLGRPAMQARSGGRVVVERGTATGSPGTFAGPFTILSPGSALEVPGHATVHGTELTGGDGMHGFLLSATVIYPQSGAPAAEVASGAVLNALDATLRGGAGGNGYMHFEICAPPAIGGAGLHLLPGDPLARIFGGVIEAGASGEPGGCPPTGTGPAVIQEGGTLGALAGPAPALVVDAVAREGQVLSAALTGEPGAFAFLAFGGKPASIYVDPLAGTLLVDAPTILSLGPIPPSGVIALAATVGELGPGIQGRLLALQAAACGSGGCALGAGSVAVLLDAAW